jgi:hypothetical protein
VTQATAELAAQVLTEEMGLRVRNPAKLVVMASQAATAAMAEPGARVALVLDLLRTGLAEMVVTGDLPVWPAMAATVPMVTRRAPMAEPVVMAVTPAWLDWEAWVDLDPLLAQAE